MNARFNTVSVGISRPTDWPGVLYAIAVTTLVAVALAGCTADLRRYMRERAERGMLENFRTLDDCERVIFVQRCLTAQRPYVTHLGTTWPSDGVVRQMLETVGRSSGITYEAPYGNAIVHFEEPVNFWLRYIELWKLKYGCGCEPLERTELLRACDPLLAEAVDSVHNSAAVRALLGTPTTPRIEFARSSVPPLDSNFVVAPGQRGLVDSLNENVSQMYFGWVGHTCSGALPNDTMPEYVAYYATPSGDIIFLKLVPVSMLEQSCLYMPELGRSGAMVVLLRRPEGSRVLLTGWYNGLCGR